MRRMRGGSLNRYHTPVVRQGGGGYEEELLKIAGPMISTSINDSVADVKRGVSAKGAMSKQAARVKRKLPKAAAKAGLKATYKRAKRAARDIL